MLKNISENSLCALTEELFAESKVYENIKMGDCSTVCYKKAYNKEKGTYDSNYINRCRVAYYLLYSNMDDEETVVYLFTEELKDRQENSFQGIGSSLEVLTVLLQKYNISNKYDNIFEAAKNANFDCACGYDANVIVDSNLKNLDLIEGIYLANELDYKRALKVLIEEWKFCITDWNEENIKTAICFNDFIDEKDSNESLYKSLLNCAFKKDRVFDIVSAYTDLIQYYIDINCYDTGYKYLWEMIESVDFSDIGGIRLYLEVLEECFEIVKGMSLPSEDLWNWGKSELIKIPNSKMFGNLYKKAIDAASHVGDPFRDMLEKEYAAWKLKVRIS